MSWQFFLLVSILGESFGRVFQKSLLKDAKGNLMAYAIWAQFSAIALLFSYGLINGLKYPTNITNILPNLLLTPFLYGAMNIFIFKALEKTDASIFTILFGARVIITVVLAVFLLKEPFSFIQSIGTLLIILSIIIVSFKKDQPFQFKKGEIYSLLSGLFLSLGVINDSFILKVLDVNSYSFLGFLGPTIFMWAVNYKSTKNIMDLPKNKIFPKILIMGAIFATAYLMYNSAYFSGQNAAQIASIFQITSVLTVLLSIFLLKEKTHIIKKILAALVGFLGVLLVG